MKNILNKLLLGAFTVGIAGTVLTPTKAQAISKMYWTDSVTDKIQRANLDGTGVTDLITTGLFNPYGIALDTSAATPVPFEFDATLGLLLVGGISGIGYFRRKNQNKSISKL